MNETIEYIGTLEAKEMYEDAGFGKVHQETIREWFKKYDLGAIKVAGLWKIDKKKFQQLLEGKYETTETPITTGGGISGEKDPKTKTH